MKIRPSTYFTIATLIFTLTLLLWSLTFTYLAAKLLPMIIAGIVSVLAGVQLSKELRRPKETAEQEATEKTETEPAYALTRYWRTAAWLGGLCLALYLLGFIIAIVIFTFSYLKSRGRGWAISVIITTLLTIFIYVVFSIFLEVDLYPGLLFELLS